MGMREPIVGDNVKILVYPCEAYGRVGSIVSVSKDPQETMPYMVEFSNFDRWPFAKWEFDYWSNICGERL